MPHKLTPSVSSRSFQQRLVLGIGAIAIVLLGTLAWGSMEWISRSVGGQADAQLLDAAGRSAALVDNYLLEKRRLVETLGATPVLVDAARAGTQRARSTGLAGQPVERLEALFDADRSMDVSARGRVFLRRLLAATDAAEAMVTDENGFNVVITERTSDFV
ncbi:MAG: hypothetical protein ACREON_10665, partial [Gemmatimonadaceae bacterium]